jgi:lysozyme
MTLKLMLMDHEEFRSKPYRDSVRAKLTIGFGRNLDDVGLSREEAGFLLDNDINAARQECSNTFPWFGGLDQVRQDVIIMMAFNCGLEGLLTFKATIEAIQKNDFQGASKEMLSSLWASEVGKRAITLSKMMETGLYPS